MSVYNRLSFTPGYANFNGADQLTQNTINFLNAQTINLNQWQINELSNNAVGGYYYNPHANTLSNLTIVLTNFVNSCNTSNANIQFSMANVTPNIMFAAATSTLSSISNFTTHTNNISGVTNSSNTALYPDLNSALAIGRQILNITNKTDSVQNNTPIMGNFTSLYVVDKVSSSNNTLYSDYNTLLNTISLVSGNSVSNITDSTMNVFISDVNLLKSILDTQSNGDINFYQNSLGVMKDYQTLLQFSNPGATQNSLFAVIGTSKLHADLGY